MSTQDIVERFLKERPLTFADAMESSVVDHLSEFYTWLMLDLPPAPELTPPQIVRIMVEDRLRTARTATTEAVREQILEYVRKGDYARASIVATNVSRELSHYLLGLCHGSSES